MRIGNAGSFTVPGDPVGKGRPRFSRSGRGVHTYTPARTAAYEQQVRQEYRMQCGDLRFNGPVHVSIWAMYSIPKSTPKRRRIDMLDGRILPMKKPDLDNIAKCICDALNGAAYEDDAQITELVIRKVYTDKPRVIVFISGKAVDDA